MVINYSDVLHDVIIEVRDILRNDDNLISTILGIAGGTVNAKNYVFASRPVDQKKGFLNPRIVVEDAFHSPDNYGNNPDSLQDDNILFQVSVWVDESPFSNSYSAVERIRILLNEVDFSISEGGQGSFEVDTVDVSPDPDKEKTRQGRVLVSARLITDGV